MRVQSLVSENGNRRYTIIPLADARDAPAHPGDGIVLGALINPTIPAIQSTFSHLPNSETLAPMVSTMSAPIVGYLLDRYKRKPVLIASILIYGFGTSIAFFLDSIYLILLIRVFGGIAVAMLIIIIPILISDYYSGNRYESIMGWYRAITAGGSRIAVDEKLQN